MSANCAIEPGRVINYKPLLDKALELSDYKVPTCIIFNRQHEKVWAKNIILMLRNTEIFSSKETFLTVLINTCNLLFTNTDVFHVHT